MVVCHFFKKEESLSLVMSKPWKLVKQALPWTSSMHNLTFLLNDEKNNISSIPSQLFRLVIQISQRGLNNSALELVGGDFLGIRNVKISNTCSGCFSDTGLAEDSL